MTRLVQRGRYWPHFPTAGLVLFDQHATLDHHVNALKLADGGDRVTVTRAKIPNLELCFAVRRLRNIASLGVIACVTVIARLPVFVIQRLSRLLIGTFNPTTNF